MVLRQMSSEFHETVSSVGSHGMAIGRRSLTNGQHMIVQVPSQILLRRYRREYQ